MKELVLGIMTNSDLADWFGVSEKTLRNSKRKKLEELQYFADFEEVKKGQVNIIKIYEPVYFKKASKNCQTIINEFPKAWSPTGLDTCKNAAKRIYDRKDELKLTVKDSTCYNYTIKGRNHYYGKPFGEPGIEGSSVYCWCVQDGFLEDGYPKYRELTPEEKQIKEKIHIKYFGNTNEKYEFIKELFEANAISKEEAWDYIDGKVSEKDFMAFKQEVEVLLGKQLIKGTQIQKFEEPGAFEI